MLVGKGREEEFGDLLRREVGEGQEVGRGPAIMGSWRGRAFAVMALRARPMWAVARGSRVPVVGVAPSRFSRSIIISEPRRAR